MSQNQLQTKPAEPPHPDTSPSARTGSPAFRREPADTHFALAERRQTPRQPVIKSAKIITGPDVNQGIYNCLVLDESPTGVLVDLGAIFGLPEEMSLHMTGGASYKARRCWAVGTKAGLAFIGSQMLSADTVEKLAQLGRMMQAQGLPATMAALRAQRFFDSAEVRHAAETAEAAYLRLEAALIG